MFENLLDSETRSSLRNYLMGLLQYINGKACYPDELAVNKYWEVALDAVETHVAEKALEMLTEYYNTLPPSSQVSGMDRRPRWGSVAWTGKKIDAFA